MKILIIRDTVCGGVSVFAGDKVDASDADARTLIAYSKARAYVAPPPRETAAIAPAKEQAVTPRTRRRRARK